MNEIKMSGCGEETEFTSLTLDRSELRSLRVNREGMNCLRMYLPYL